MAAAAVVPAWQLRPRGSGQGGTRQYNERVVLQAVRLAGDLAGAEIARRTGLTAQTVSLITKRLLDDGLLVKRDPQRGKVGQPSVPLALNPDGAFAVGIKVGRRSMDLLLVDFTGAVRERWSLAYAYPDPAALGAEIGLRLRDLRRKLGPARRARVQGVGIALPLSMGGWQTLLDMPPNVAQAWAACDLRSDVAALTDWPVEQIKDTAAATVAELVAGRGRSVKSFLYIFVDTFIGGGLVIDSHLSPGLNGNAGAVASLPLRLAAARGRAVPEQLLSVASLVGLERAYAAAGLDLAAIEGEQTLQAPWRSHTERWIGRAAPAIALAINSAACLLDLGAVIVDGSFGRGLLGALLSATETSLGRYSWEGVVRPQLLPGAIGSDARAIGAAMLPLHANFAPDRDLFLKAG